MVGEVSREFAPVLLVDVAEDVLSEVLELSYDVPSEVVVDASVDVGAYPCEDFLSGFETVDEFVDGVTLGLSVVEVDVEVGRQVQFVGEVTEYLLEEGVDGQYAELAVLMYE